MSAPPRWWRGRSFGAISMSSAASGTGDDRVGALQGEKARPFDVDLDEGHFGVGRDLFVEHPLVNAAPEGTCFRLPASLNLGSNNPSPYGLTLARAVQQYGMVMTDATTTGLVVYGEIPTD